MENVEKKVWRMSLILPEELGEKIVAMRTDPRYVRMSYAEILRILIEAGLKQMKDED